MTDRINKFWGCLLKWHNENARDYPWRRTKNPYYVLTAEFLLQQTHVRKVSEVYERFLSKYPTPRHLAAAELMEASDIIKPIGLTYRAERLKKCAEIICREFSGEVPNTAEQLRRLPGVGSYICDAVLCYAFGFSTVPIDTNVIRLFCRYFGFKSEKARPRDDALLAENIRNLYQFENTRIPNLAVLDFAAAICTAKKPRCQNCPLRINCLSTLS